MELQQRKWGYRLADMALVESSEKVLLLFADMENCLSLLLACSALAAKVRTCHRHLSNNNVPREN